VTDASGDLASVIAELADRLPTGHITSWARILRSVPASGLGVHAIALEARLIDARPGITMGGAAARLIAAWQAPLTKAALFTGPSGRPLPSWRSSRMLTSGSGQAAGDRPWEPHGPRCTRR